MPAKVDGTQGLTTRIITIDPRRLVLLKHNAHYQSPEEHQRLVENIKRDGRLTSVPFAALIEGTDGDYEVLSGNHRVKAAVEAGLAEIDVMVTDDPLSKERRNAIALSHNAIKGRDNHTILATLYEGLGQGAYKQYAALGEGTLARLKANAEKAKPVKAAPQEPQEAKERWVSLTTVLGAVMVPASAAVVIGDAIDAMLERGELTDRAKWRALELWAADYLAGAEGGTEHDGI